VTVWYALLVNVLLKSKGTGPPTLASSCSPSPSLTPPCSALVHLRFLSPHTRSTMHDPPLLPLFLLTT